MPAPPPASDHVLSLAVEATDGAARAGTVTTARGTFRTPVFMPVGTRAAVRTLSSADLEDLGSEVILGNTYHLMLKPGAELVAELGGLHGFADWKGHLLTDSGGYQIFSLEPKVTDDGATFRSTYDGSSHHLTPEGSVAVQQQLASDIMMVLDVCPPLPSPLSTHPGRGRPLGAVGRPGQGRPTRPPGPPARPRPSSASSRAASTSPCAPRAPTRTVEVDFDGYGIGGLSVGEPLEEMLPALAATTAILPVDQPRYLMGVGDPVSIVEAVALGVDMFDCVLPTRLARHGTILTGQRPAEPPQREVHARPRARSTPSAVAPPVPRWSRAYLRHLLMVSEPTVARLTTIHNVHWLLRLMEAARAAIVAGTYDAFRRSVVDVWGAPST